MEITISGEDKKQLQKVENLAKRLGLQIIQSTTKSSKVVTAKTKEAETKNNSEKLHELMEEAAARGDLFKTIDDPVAWQREQRKDRVLPGREE